MQKFTFKPGMPGVGVPLKLLLVMKLTIVLFFTSILSVNADSFAQKITLDERSAPLEKVLNVLRVQSGYDVVYSMRLMEKAKPVTVNIKNLPVEEALKKCFEGQDLTFEIREKTVLVKEKKASFFDRILKRVFAIDVTGKVVDENGFPLAGATVKEKGTTRGTTTSVKGDFYLADVEEDALLEISFIGYVTREIKPAPQLGEIKMEPSTRKMDTVNITINTGYQSIARSRSAGSVSKPDMEVYNNRVGSMNVIQRLDGLIPGLTVNNAPSADQFQVRGLTTVGSTINIGGFAVPTTSRSPLFVVDGVPYEDINLLNPNDVMDVNVLKDATASSIWGARAANGVIVITTKSGNRHNKLKIDYNSFVRFQNRPDLSYLPVLNSQEFIQAAKETFSATVVPWANVNSGSSPFVAPHEKVLYDVSRGLLTQSAADAKLDSMSRLSNLNQMSDLFYRNSLITNHSLSVSTGSEKYSFYGSFNYTGNRNSNNRPDNNSNIYKLNLRQDFNFNKHISLYLVTDITNSISKSKPWPTFDSRFTPYQLFQDQNGNNLDLSWRYLTDELRSVTESRGKIGLEYEPVEEAGYGFTNANALALRVNSGLKVNILTGLRFEGTYSYVLGKNNTRRLEDQKAFDVRREVLSYASFAPATNTVTYYFPKTGGRLSTTDNSRKDWTIRNQFTYNKNWNGSTHELTLLAGNEVQSSEVVNLNQLTRGWDDDLNTLQLIDYKLLAAGSVSGIIYPTAGGVARYLPDLLSNQNLDTRLLSYYANLNYSFASKYGLNASWRIDQSNLFGKDKSAQNKPVWSVGSYWNIQKENWMNDISWISDLRLRATYGITGNSPAPGTAASQDILLARSPSGFSVPDGVIYTINSPANVRLTWELTKNKNIGLDFSLLDGRLGGSFDMYWKKTEGFLDRLLVNPFASIGQETIFGNAGTLTNQGIELSLTTLNVRSGSFSWRTLLNGAFNKNRIIEAYSNINSGPLRVAAPFVEGFSSYPVFAYDFQSLDALGDPLIRLNNGDIVKAPNITKNEDVLYMGTAQPKWSGGFNNTFRYRAIDLQVNIIFNAGHVMRKDVNARYTGVNAQSNNFHADFAKRWQKPGDENTTDIPAFVPTTSLNTSRRFVFYYILGDNNVVDASFAKLRDITLSYNLPRRWLKKYGIEQLSVFGQAGNILLWTANKYGIDPEFQNARVTSGTGRTLRTGQNTVSFGVNLSL